MYAIIDQKGHQYKVSPGEEIDIDNLNVGVGEVITTEKILLLVEGDKVQIGKPYVSGVEVTLKVIKIYKGDKIRVSRFKAKSRYTRVSGFRPQLLRVKVESIGNIKEPSKPTKKPKVKTKK